ncbi:MAG: haloacid dehalogenase type II [Betaproteobacteria bacterium]
MIENSARPYAVDALVFDAYGTLFDVQSVAATAEALFPGRGATLARLWRSKQLEYSWLQSLMQSPMQPREDFAAVTGHALGYAAEALALPLSSHARHRLLDAYLDLSPFPDVEPTLAALAPRPRLILSNGTRAMLEPLAAATGLARHLAAILSVDDAGVYKPSPRVYQLAVDELKCLPIRIGFVSSNAWDAIGAKAFGFTVFWINRAGAPLDRHGPRPDCTISTLADLPALLAGV